MFTRKEIATDAQRLEILDWYHKNGKNQTRTAQHFNAIYPNLKLQQPTISAWLKNEQKWRERAAHPGQSAAKRQLQTQHPEVAERMEIWLGRALAQGLLLTGDVLRQKWKSFAELAGIPASEQLSLSNGWLERFKKRHGLREFNRHGEAASADPEKIETERLRIQKLIQTHGYEPRDIYNMDETGLFYGYARRRNSDNIITDDLNHRMAPDRGLSDKARAGVKAKKTRLTYAFTANADGSDKRPPLVIGRWKKPRAFAGRTAAQLGFLYRNNGKAWMTMALYQEWIVDWDRELSAKGRKILLLQDNFSGHVPPEHLCAIRVENFEPNLTAHVQPNDQGIIRCFKAHYRAKFIERAVNRYDAGCTPADIYEINQLEAMRLADAAWREVDRTTIHHCWLKSGILPNFPDAPVPTPTIPVSSLLNSAPCDPVAGAEVSVEQALDALVHRGALQKTNRMDIQSLLNPAIEAELVPEISDLEIFDAVRETQEDGDAGEGDNEVVLDCPTRREVLQAAAVLTRYAGTLDNALARKVEDVLASFSRQLRLDSHSNMVPTSITDYFSRK